VTETAGGCRTISKVLSGNDTGETGSHQAGIYVPKDGQILSFFPKLPSSLKNPRKDLIVTDREGNEWGFIFVYYNNKHFGGTRDEYRLTCMTKFIGHHHLKIGDTLTLSKTSSDSYRVDYIRSSDNSAGKVLRLGNRWRAVNIKGAR